MRRLLHASTALVTAAALLNPVILAPALAVTAPQTEPSITLATQSGTVGAGQAANSHYPATTSLSVQAKIAALRQKVKYVFVLFQENRSFDHYFGTYPGANGLFTTYSGASAADQYSQPANTFSSSFNSVIRNVDGTYSTISPFLIPRQITNQAGATVQLYPESLYSVDHSHTGYINDFHADQATKSQAKNDGYPLNQQGLHYSGDTSGLGATGSIVGSNGAAPTSNPNLQTKQKGEVVISHVDCDTIPFMWQLADRFVLFDNFHQTATGPSTPNAIAMIAGQVGDTQWVKHPADATAGTANGALHPSYALPNLNDNGPFSGSTFDKAKVQPPYGPDEASNPLGPAPFVSSPSSVQLTLTFATVPLSLIGNQMGTYIRADQNPTVDLMDVQHDILTISAKNPTVTWAWYQQGYGPEPFDGESINENGWSTSNPPGVGSLHYNPAPQNASYIVHHNGPQYFGYLGDNTKVVQPQGSFNIPNQPGMMHGLQQFFTDVSAHALPAAGGVFYIRGGYYNNDGLLPADPNPNVKAATPGNDDHPNYSDAQISEALIADEVNAIANSPYWADCAIIITYDETDGAFDHQPEKFRTYGPDGQPETGGPRIPTIVISPYAAAHTVSHVYSEHSSVIKFLDELFNLVPLADLPDEAAARTAGASNSAFNGPSGPQTNLGPGDALATMGDLLEAFDDGRLSGTVTPLPASYAIIDPAAVKKLPQYVTTDGQGNITQFPCQVLGIVPTDYPGGTYTPGAEIDPPPQDFNPRPTQSPGAPYFNTSSNTTAGSLTGTGSPWPN
jgi:phospholipase C